MTQRTSPPASSRTSDWPRNWGWMEMPRASRLAARSGSWRPRSCRAAQARCGGCGTAQVGCSPQPWVRISPSFLFCCLSACSGPVLCVVLCCRSQPAAPHKYNCLLGASTSAQTERPLQNIAKLANPLCAGGVVPARELQMWSFCAIVLMQLHRSVRHVERGGDPVHAAGREVRRAPPRGAGGAGGDVQGGVLSRGLGGVQGPDKGTSCLGPCAAAHSRRGAPAPVDARGGGGERGAAPDAASAAEAAVGGGTHRARARRGAPGQEGERDQQCGP
mmetsp:Transcript_64760/g.204482  ORF Transcript_64760/g.204482 Transcript_64760/m.204482 type:complete len:275 (-) Transcript_64760:380-1204(-)